MFELTDSGIVVHFDLIKELIVAHPIICGVLVWILYGLVVYRFSLPRIRKFNKKQAEELIEQFKLDCAPLSSTFWDEIWKRSIRNYRCPLTDGEIAVHFVGTILLGVPRAILMTLGGVIWLPLSMMMGIKGTRQALRLIFGSWTFSPNALR